MQIEEHISGEVQTYDFEEETWVTRYTLDDSNVIDASTRRQCCADGAFEIGTAYAATMQLVCRLPGATRFQIRGAKIVLRSQYGSENAPEPLGEFWVTDAQKIGDIFTLSGQCAVGWTDTSSYNELSADAAESMAHLIAPDGAAAPLQELLGHRTSSTECVTDFVNMFVRVQTGIPDMIRWEDFDTVVNGDYCNRWIYEQYIDPADGQTKWRKTAYPAQFSVWNGNGVSATDCPRDYYRWMSQLAGGFITSKRNGALTLRQYAMPELGTAVITTADIEENGCEVADYTLQIYRVSVTPDLETEYWVSGMSVFTDPLYASRVPIRIAVESNPVLDGFCKRWIIDELEASMVLYFTGISRESANIIDLQKKNTAEGNLEAIEAMHRIKASVDMMKITLLKGDMHEFASILGQAWEDKKKMAGPITNPGIQEVMDVAKASGAISGKVSGAGGGGFIMFMVEPTRKKQVIDALGKLSGFVMPFQFTDGGAHAWKIYPTDSVKDL